MASARTRLDPHWFRKVVETPEVKEAVRRKAEEVANNARHIIQSGGSAGQDVPISVHESKTDRPNVQVSVAHPAATALEAKHGLLARAVSQTGSTLN